jgi:hypothetical protein
MAENWGEQGLRLLPAVVDWGKGMHRSFVRIASRFARGNAPQDDIGGKWTGEGRFTKLYDCAATICCLVGL